jgi:hypothetical protein
MAWDKHTKPPGDFCPGKYCVQWVPPGGAADLSGRTCRSFQDAITRRADWTEFPQGGCGCGFGVCTRLDPVAGDHDWYEPCKPALERDGLPWFYFIPSLDDLAPEFHERYLRESRALWGGDQDAEPHAAPDGGA